MKKRYAKLNLHKLVNPDNEDEDRSKDIFKSHAYSKAVRSADASSLSLPQRRSIAENRRMIGEYRRSQVGGQHNYMAPPPTSEQSASGDAPANKNEGVIGNRPMGSGSVPANSPREESQEDKAALERRQHPIVPPRRNFGGL